MRVAVAAVLLATAVGLTVNRRTPDFDNGIYATVTLNMKPADVKAGLANKEKPFDQWCVVAFAEAVKSSTLADKALMTFDRFDQASFQIPSTGKTSQLVKASSSGHSVENKDKAVVHFQIKEGKPTAAEIFDVLKEQAEKKDSALVKTLPDMLNSEWSKEISVASVQDTTEHGLCDFRAHYVTKCDLKTNDGCDDKDTWNNFVTNLCDKNGSCSYRISKMTDHCCKNRFNAHHCADAGRVFAKMPSCKLMTAHNPSKTYKKGATKTEKFIEKADGIHESYAYCLGLGYSKNTCLQVFEVAEKCLKERACDTSTSKAFWDCMISDKKTASLFQLA